LLIGHCLKREIAAFDGVRALAVQPVCDPLDRPLVALFGFRRRSAMIRRRRPIKLPPTHVAAEPISKSGMNRADVPDEVTFRVGGRDRGHSCRAVLRVGFDAGFFRCDPAH
jgi:hypothetical protein